MSEDEFWEQSDDEDAGVVDSLRMGARVQAAKKNVSDVSILENMLVEKEELLETEKTPMGKHETSNWIKWIKRAIATIEDE